MKKIFISQPMNGLTEAEIMKYRSAAIKNIRDKYGNVEILDSYFRDKKPNDTKNEGLYRLGQSLILLSKADLVVFLPGWSNSRGCKLEYKAALEYGLEIVS